MFLKQGSDLFSIFCYLRLRRKFCTLNITEKGENLKNLAQGKLARIYIFGTFGFYERVGS